MKALGLLIVMVALFGGLGCATDCPAGEYDDNNCISPDPTDAAPISDGNSAPAPVEWCDENGRCPEAAQEVAEVIQELREERKSCAPGSFVWDDKLAGLAQACTQQMSRAQNTQVCVNTLGGRLLDQGISSNPAPAELYAKAGTVDAMRGELENSPFLSYYLDNCSFTDVAVGLSRDDAGWYWLCLVFR